MNAPVDPRVCLAITQWPPDAPRGAVTTFCAEHQISRKTFYEIRKRAADEGPAAALEPRSRRPKNSPTTPISVHEKMRAMGMSPAPWPASLARIFRDAGVARLEPKKKPRAAFRRFVYLASNACWQLDATEYVLTGCRECVIFQLIDDHARYAVASHVAWSETAGSGRHGRDQRHRRARSAATPSVRQLGRLPTSAIGCPRNGRGVRHSSCGATAPAGSPQSTPPRPEDRAQGTGTAASASLNR